jgi:hypothetical protein
MENMTSTTMGMMTEPAYAMMYQTSFVSPASGIRVTGNVLSVAVKVTGFTDSCATAGKPLQEGLGHYHLLLDHSLINMYCTPHATVSLQNVKPGMHQLTVVPALNDHSEVEANGQTISFDYQPVSPLADIIGASFPGPPSIKILSPRNGATVSGTFPVRVEITNFHPSCDLYGKADVGGYGHWHLNHDGMSGPMMGMGTMMGMSCATTFMASTAGFAPGSTHTLIALLVGDSHAPLMPSVDDMVKVTIG